MNILSFTGMHDTNVGVYSQEQNKYWTFEFEKLFEEKNFDTRILMHRMEFGDIFDYIDRAFEEYVYPITGIKKFDGITLPWSSYSGKLDKDDPAHDKRQGIVAKYGLERKDIILDKKNVSP